jgi:hypothetical protein
MLETAEQNFIAVFMRISLFLVRFRRLYDDSLHDEVGCGIVPNCPMECGIGAIGHSRWYGPAARYRALRCLVAVA